MAIGILGGAVLLVLGIFGKEYVEEMNADGNLGRAIITENGIAKGKFNDQLELVLLDGRPWGRPGMLLLFPQEVGKLLLITEGIWDDFREQMPAGLHNLEGPDLKERLGLLSTAAKLQAAKSPQVQAVLNEGERRWRMRSR